MHTKTEARVTAIIPTTCSIERAAVLHRAIKSLLSASIDPIRILVVVNGRHFDKGLLQTLELRQDIEILQIDIGSAPLAQLEGRRRVNTEFFCFLDDDDEYTKGAIDKRLEILSNQPSTSLVATNGIVVNNDGLVSPCFKNLKNASKDPLLQLLNENWLSSCGGLYRTSLVSAELFEDYAEFVEWTWLAFKLAVSGHKIHIADEPTFRIHRTPKSASMSDAYIDYHIILFKKMLSKTNRPDLVNIINKRLSAAWHSSSEHYLRKKQYRNAWHAHFKSLLLPHGWKYLPFTRHLIIPTSNKMGPE